MRETEREKQKQTNKTINAALFSLFWIYFDWISRSLAGSESDFIGI